jgi:hypothetical protein
VPVTWLLPAISEGLAAEAAIAAGTARAAVAVTRPARMIAFADFTSAPHSPTGCESCQGVRKMYRIPDDFHQES